MMLGNKFIEINSFYTSPCESSDVNCFVVKHISRPYLKSINEIKYKFVRLKYSNDSFVVLPLIHSKEW